MMKNVTMSALFASAEQAASAAAKLQALRAASVRVDRYDTEASEELSVGGSRLTAEVSELVQSRAQRVIEECGGRPSV